LKSTDCLEIALGQTRQRTGNQGTKTEGVRLSTVDLPIKVASFVTKVNNNFLFENKLI